MLLNVRHSRRQEGGFTLIELMITVLIVTIGLLGLAKLQATAVSNTAASRTRALMTYQAESLAGMIRANKGFWVTSGSTAVDRWFKVSAAGAPTDSGQMQKLGSTGSCVDVGTCTPENLAYDDMYTWAKAFNDGTANSAFPGAQASIVCVPVTGSTCAANPATPHGYDITLTWNQKQVAVNRSTATTAATAASAVSMVMHVQP
jgi:type IV pilus assembly protein PilV